MSPEERVEIRARLDAATPGPWVHGDRWHVAGARDGKRCVYCDRGDPSWVGRRSINGKMMIAHVHEDAEPWWRHGINAVREDGPVSVVVDTDEYGYMTDADADLIAHAPTDIAALLDALDEATPPTPGPDTERSPDGLVGRVARAEGSLLGSEWTTEGRARSAAAAIADWLEECDPQRMTAYGAAADLIRREVEGAGRE